MVASRVSASRAAAGPPRWWLAGIVACAVACAAPDAAPDERDTGDIARDGGTRDAADAASARDAANDAVADAAPPADAAATDAPSDASSACPARPTLGLFVWRDDLVAARDDVLAVAVAEEVTEIYLHANLFYAGDEPEAALVAWIEAARASCIEVELLFGNAAWIRTPVHAEATMRTAWSVAFADAHPSARPSGVHFDLEPQQLTEWRAMPAMQPTYVSELVDVLEEMTPVAEAGGLPLTVDIGFFLDGLSVTRVGVTRPGSEWITDAVSRVVVMDYRDSALSTGFGGMIDLAEDEVAYASSVGTPIVLAAETTVQDPPYITFAEEGRAAMRATLAEVRAHFMSAPAFAGMAIHDDEGLAALGP